MLAAPFVNTWGLILAGAGTGITGNLALTVTPGNGTGAPGSWVQVFASTDVTADLYELILEVRNGNANGFVRNAAFDIGIDPAGGTSYTPICEHLLSGNSATSTTSGPSCYRLPLFIPAGSSVAIRSWGNSSSNPAAVAVYGYGAPSRPELVRGARHYEAMGWVGGANGVGTSVTPGASGANGSWVSLGTTSKDHWWWQLGLGFVVANSAATSMYFDLAYGDASNKIMIISPSIWVSPDTTEKLTHYMDAVANCHVPAGSEIFVRGSANIASPFALHAVALGLGG